MAPNLTTMQPAETMDMLQDYYFPPYITLAHMFHAPQGWAIRNRLMSQYILQYVVDGFADYPVGDQPYETHRGDLLFHRPNELHSIIKADDRPYVCISLVFHFGTSAFPYEELFKGKHLLGNFADHPVETMLSQLVTHYRQPGLVHQMHCQSLLMSILAQAAQGNETSTRSDAITMPKLVLIKNYLTEHYSREIQIKELEDVSGLSKNYILTLFRQHVGMSPMQYLTWIRINKAKELAIHSNLSFSEIADRVGYSDVHTFGRMFKKKTGQSLTQFCANLIYS
ncbi:helix-turn-helix transcriptional regulator [Paenibacillus roseipurpureus]|uniref:AraC family transcriptional regulator n=1 Tax=Paenibacillus roseopurpureus TaxID=2918901 RepID=A0AA96RMA1_9BACL|nr:AraC family transcriptional regulator [Paenibacillus sp. MBLB1832]WNR46234.1 AraC family transcriptional regulator [Paenibacillus sp. MBLB1832]